MAKLNIEKQGGGEVKSPKALKSVENEFERAMSSMVDLMSRIYRNQVIEGLDQQTINKFEDAQVGNYASVFLSISKRISRKLRNRFDDKRIEQLSRRMLEKNDKRSREQLYKAVEGAVGISSSQLLAADVPVPQKNALILETAQWAKKLRDETLELYTANSLRVMANGGTIEEVMSQFSEMEEKRKNHAKFTARNQINNFNSIMTKNRAQRLGIEKAIWVTSSDERVRECHRVRDGKEFDLSEGLYSSCDGKTLLPGTDYQCFPYESKLNHASFCKKLYRRWFTGELTEIVTADGVILRSTPNHPVFTDKGFKPARLVDSSDYILKAVDKGFDIVEIYGKDYVPSIGQVFSAFDLLGVEHSVSASVGGEFHGDISDGEVNVIGLDRLLMDEINPSIREKFSKLGLSESDEMVVLDSLTCLGNGFFAGRSSFDSDSGFMSILDLVSSSFIRHLTPLELFGFALGSWADSDIEKPFSNDNPANGEMFGDCVFAFSVLVHGFDLIKRKIELIRLGSLPVIDSKVAKLPREDGLTDSDSFGCLSDGNSISYKFDSVIDNRAFDFSGHVYNLETVSNDYIINTSAVSNCRCTYRLIIPES